MSSFAAASLVIGILVLVGGPLLWWVFFRMESDPKADPHQPPPEPPRPMTLQEVASIEEALEVTLPKAYRSFVTSPRDFDEVDESSINSDPAFVIEATMVHRNGVAGLRPWPHDLVYIGDEADACPYVIDCATGKISRLHKGNLDTPPLKTFASFEKLLAYLRRVAEESRLEVPPKGRWAEFWDNNSSIILTLLVIFVVMPAIALGITELFKWLFR